MIWSTAGGTGSEPRPNLCLSLTHWDSWPDSSTDYFLCTFLCLLLPHGVISVCLLASFFQAVQPMPYHLNSPLPVLRVPVLLEWGREDHHRDNFSSEHGSDIPGSNFSGCFVLPYYWDFCLGRESVTTHCFLRTSQKLKGLPVFNPHPPPPLK